MASGVRGKSIKALIRDVAEGYVAVNPLFLKSFEPELLRDFYHEISKIQIDIRSEKFPTRDILAIRNRNVRLQRLYSAVMIIRNFARERRIALL
ncbi:MAG: hypothetical protein C0402_16225 [Thermodesulfovibrio sp.]|nr:hypothetical protein [Thermodesulfovibrio sp.]